MAKIAVELKQALTQRALTGAPPRTTQRPLAGGEGWTVSDVVCTCGPQDRPFEEQHSGVTIAIVTAGSFQYRASTPGSGNGELMTPGSLLLGNAGQFFECAHTHGAGDRCLAFRYAPEHFERLAGEAGARRSERNFHVLRLPPLRASAPLIARACAALNQPGEASWEELSVEIAVHAIQSAAGIRAAGNDAPPSALARVTRVARMIEANPDSAEGLSLKSLAEVSGLSRYHFLRTFENLTGLTPHQYVRRARLREAAVRLAADSGSVLDIALDCGFGDISNFNRAFRAEFGVSPRGFRTPV